MWLSGRLDSGYPRTIEPRGGFNEMTSLENVLLAAMLPLVYVFLFDLIAIPLSLLLHFIPLSLSLLCPPIWAVLHHLYMYMVAFLALRILYVIALVCFVFVPCSPPESLPGKDVLCRLLPRPLPSVCFLFFSFLFRPCSPPICFGETSSIL